MKDGRAVDEQRRTPLTEIESPSGVSRVRQPGAPFLFTAAEIAGADDGGVTGTMNGVTFHYYAVPNYRTLVAEYGFVPVDIHDDPGVSTYFLARKSR